MLVIVVCASNGWLYVDATGPKKQDRLDRDLRDLCLSHAPTMSLLVILPVGRVS
jgi:hypothetical protein